MDRERLNRLLEEPAHVAREDIADLKAMTERYPWFSGAHLLLAVGEHAAGDVLFDEQLRTTAAHLPSRTVLFDEVEARRSTPELRVVEMRLETREVLPEPVPVMPEPAMVVAPGIEAHATHDIEERLLERQIIEAAAASAYRLMSEPVEEPPQAPIAPTIEAPPMVIARTEEPAVQVVVEPPMVVQPDTRKRFSDWLSMSETSAPNAGPGGVRLDQALEAPDAKAWLREQVTTEVTAPTVPEPRKAPVVDTKQLIDRFIQQATPEPQRKAEFFSPQVAGKRSLQEHADLVTETLARIHEKQGNLPKAIDAYKRLAERFPDRSAYFLSLAKGLEGRAGSK